MAKNEILSKDFFNNASKMTLSQYATFLKNVVLNTDPRKLAPIIVWSAPGCAKSVLTEEIVGASERGLKTVILSQIGPLDCVGLAHIEKDDNRKDMTKFTPTDTFGRGKHHLFLDELNNSAPSTLAAVQNLLSAKKMGEDDYSDVHIICACNPPSTNSLANDLNFPTISRCINIVLDYTLDDYVNYAMASGTQHPSIVAFHKKTSGRFLQAKWSIYPGSAYEVPEPMANEPFPCPRSFSLASNAIYALSGAKVNNIVDYTLLKPLIEGAVGIQAASEFATTYAYMNRIPDIEAIFSGELKAKEHKLEDTVAVQFLTMMSCINHGISKINEAAKEGVTSRIDSNKSEAYKLLSGIHYCVRFMGEAASSELATMALMSLVNTLRESKLSQDFISKLLNGVGKGATATNKLDGTLLREDIIRYSKSSSISQLNVSEAIG